MTHESREAKQVELPLIRASHIPTSCMDISRTERQRNERKKVLFCSLELYMIFAQPYLQGLLLIQNDHEGLWQIARHMTIKLSNCKSVAILN